MSVGRICSREVVVAAADEMVLGVAQRLGQHRVGMVVVTDAAGVPLGVVTDRDLVLRVMAAARDPGSTPLGVVMTKAPKIVQDDSPIETALGLMRGCAVRRLPVVDASGRLVGVVSVDDILALLAEEFAHIGAVLAAQAP